MIIWALGLSICSLVSILYQRRRTVIMIEMIEQKMTSFMKRIEAESKDVETQLEYLHKMLENQSTTLEVIAGQHAGPKRPRSAFD